MISEMITKTTLSLSPPLFVTAAVIAKAALISVHWADVSMTQLHKEHEFTPSASEVIPTF